MCNRYLTVLILVCVGKVPYFYIKDLFSFMAINTLQKILTYNNTSPSKSYKIKYSPE